MRQRVANALQASSILVTCSGLLSVAALRSQISRRDRPPTRRAVPGAARSAKSWSAVQLRGAPPNASARGRDQRLLNAGLRDRHAPEAPRRIRLVAQDAGFSIRQRGFDSLMRRHISTHGGQQVYEASSGGSTPPGDTDLFVVGRSRLSEGCAPGSTPGEETAGMEQRWLTSFIRSESVGSIPTPATLTTRGGTRVS